MLILIGPIHPAIFEISTWALIGENIIRRFKLSELRGWICPQLIAGFGLTLENFWTELENPRMLYSMGKPFEFVKTLKDRGRVIRR